METNGNKFDAEKTPIFECLNCDFICFKKSEYKRHILTEKHLRKQKWKHLETFGNQKTPDCLCGKRYKTRSGLWKHKMTCKIVQSAEPFSEINESVTNEENDLFLKNMVMEVIKNNNELQKQNQEFKELLFEQNKIMLEFCKDKSITTTYTTNNNNNNNNNNKTFNLQFFLNETCKDAMNLMDFVDSVKLQLSDLEKVGEIGFVNGISDIIIKNLKKLDIHKRPVHCTDTKREVLYVKDEDKWEKDNQENKKIRKAIKHIAHKNTRLLKEFKDKNPDYNKCDSNKSDLYNKIVIEAMGGAGDNDIEKENKIIKKIAKEVIIDK